MIHLSAACALTMVGVLWIAISRALARSLREDFAPGRSADRAVGNGTRSRGRLLNRDSLTYAPTPGPLNTDFGPDHVDGRDMASISAGVGTWKAPACSVEQLNHSSMWTGGSQRLRRAAR